MKKQCQASLYHSLIQTVCGKNRKSLRIIAEHSKNNELVSIALINSSLIIPSVFAYSFSYTASHARAN